MKKNILLLTISFACLLNTGFAQQYFFDDFESYTVNTFVGPASPDWTTWSGVEGGSEDAQVVNTKAASGTKSIYFVSAGGNGPQDVVLGFGGVKTSGRFKFTSKFFVPTGKAAYFNFQGGVNPGTIWAIEFYMRSGGSFDITSGGGLTGTYPQNKWFELVIDVNLDTDIWEVFIDGVSKGTFTNTNPISYIDIFPADANSEYWVDDVSFCVNNACNPEISLDAVSITPSSLCTNQPADVTIKMKNNSSFSAKEMTLDLVVGTDKISKKINLNNLAGGKDTTFTVPGLFKSKIAGTNLLVKAINAQGDIKPSNDTATTTINATASPSGSDFVKGTPFTSPNTTSSGIVSSPDIVAPGDVLTYEITKPNVFSNASYGSLWEIKNITLRSSGGVVLASSFYSFTPANASANAKFTFTPDATLIDSNVTLFFTVVDKNSLCDSSLSRYIHIAPKPTSGYSAINVCDKEDMQFDNTSLIHSGILNHMWYFGDKTTSNLTSPAKKYLAPGKYTVKLVVTSDYGYMDSTTQQVEVFPIPNANFEFTNACEGTALTFTDKSTLPSGTPTYVWDFGTSPASGSNLQNPTKLFGTPGLYNTTLKVTVNGCSAQTSKWVTQAPRSKPNFKFTSTQCDNLDVSFTDTTPALPFGSVGYKWSFGDGMEIAEKSPKHTYNLFKTFDVTLITSTNLGCVDSVKKAITLRESPKPVFTPNGNSCSYQTINFANSTNVPSGSVNTYSWSFGDGNSSTDANPNNIFLSAGVYKIQLSALSSNGCDGETETSITINENPVADFIANNVCLGGETKFENGSSIPNNAPLTYTWDLDNGAGSINTNNPTITFTNAKTYNVRLIATTTAGCADTIIKPVGVYALPPVDINYASNYTGDGAVLFNTTSTGAGYRYFWNFGDGGNANVQNPKYIYKLAGTWPVKLTIRTAEGCESELSRSVFVNPLSVSTFNANKWSVYPNPSNGAFIVKFEGIALSQINISDMLGKTITTLTPSANVNEMPIDLSNQSAGIYIITLVDTNGKTSTQKISIAK